MKFLEGSSFPYILCGVVPGLGGESSDSERSAKSADTDECSSSNGVFAHPGYFIVGNSYKNFPLRGFIDGFPHG